MHRVTEILHQEQKKSVVTRWLEWAFMFRSSPRKYARYTEKRFNPLNGKVE